jgi:hypothetical protein
VALVKCPFKGEAVCNQEDFRTLQTSFLFQFLQPGDQVVGLRKVGGLLCKGRGVDTYLIMKVGIIPESRPKSGSASVYHEIED